MDAYTPTSRSRLRRLYKRGLYDPNSVYEILDAGLICHVGYVIDSQPYVTPTSYWRDGDRLYWHGSSASRMVRTVKSGVPACLTVMMMDGLVVARSGFHSSVNYRSVMCFGTARQVEGRAAKLEALEAFADRMFPNRWADFRPPLEKGDQGDDRPVHGHRGGLGQGPGWPAGG